MSLNINLFVHGVPMGQKIWGPKGDDQKYISSFYGPKWDAPEVMKIDVMTFGGITYCYYSFVKGQNVFDSQGRAGSYVALTLRINAFYADVQNIYSVLKAAYDKICVGLCVSETEGSTKWLLSDLQNIDSKLTEIENHIINYISEFSITDDIISLNGFSSGGQGATLSVNLHECTKKFAQGQIYHSGKFMVSPWYLSASAAKTVAQYKDEMQKAAETAQKEIRLEKQAAQDKIDKITKQSQDELRISKEQHRKQLDSEREDFERKIAKIKEGYADVDVQIDSFKKTIRDRERELSDWQSQCRKKDKEMQSNSRNVQKLEQQISKLQSDLAEIRAEKGYRSLPEPKRVNWLIVSAVSFFILLLIMSMIWFTIHYINGQKREIQSLNEKIEQLDDSIQNYIIQFGNNPMNDEDPKIIIKELIGDKNDIKVGETYHIYLSPEDSVIEDGKWESNEFEIEGNTIMAKREYVDKLGKITYKDKDKEIASIEVYIKE